MELGKYLNQTILVQHGAVFSHNPLHDLESLWWVGVWILLCHYQPDKLRDIKVQKHIEIIKHFSETLFNNRIDPDSRHDALIGSALLANTKPAHFSEAVQQLILMLDLFREELIAYYERYKPKKSQDPSFFIPDVHRKFGHVFEDAMKELGSNQTGLWPLDHIEKQITYYNARE